MKHQTVTLVKFKALSKRLGVPLYRTVGILESLWIFAQIQAREGDLSKFSDLELAAWIEWEGDESELINALVETRWLDRVGDHLTIHDWEEHRPYWLKGVQSEKRQHSSQHSAEHSSQHSAALPRTRAARTQPNLTEPNPTQPNGRVDATGGEDDHEEISVTDFAAVRSEAQRVGKVLGKPGSDRDRQFVYKVAWLSLSRFGENWLWDAVNGISVKKPPPKNKFSYLTKCLKTACEKQGTSLGKELAMILLPDELLSAPPPVDLSDRSCAAISGDD